MNWPLTKFRSILLHFTNHQENLVVNLIEFLARIFFQKKQKLITVAIYSLYFLLLEIFAMLYMWVSIEITYKDSLSRWKAYNDLNTPVKFWKQNKMLNWLLERYMLQVSQSYFFNKISSRTFWCCNSSFQN